MIAIHKTMFLDIETVSTVATFTELSEPMQQLWVKKSKLINKDSDDYAATFVGNAGIYAEFGKIICISMGYFTGEDLQEFKIKKFSSHSETEVLTAVFDVFNKFFIDNTFMLSGHNIKEFDVPYICRRALINGLELPFFFKDLQNRKPWENPLLDTLHLWRFGDFKHYTSLNLLAAVFSIPTPKDDIDGSQVGNVYWQEKDLDRIATYCSKDVLTVAQIVLKLHHQPLISNEKIVFI
jgi:3'-5' exonuclease